MTQDSDPQPDNAGSNASPPDHTSRYGIGMMVLVWLIILGALGYFSYEWSKHQFTPNTQIDGTQNAQGVKEIQLKMNRSGHYIASGNINNVSAVYLLDTGATYTTVPAQLAKQANLPIGRPITLSTANGTITSYTSTIEKLILGNITLTNVRAVINPNTDDDFILLGMSALKPLELIHRDKLLTIRQYPN